MPFADVERSQTQATGHLSYLQNHQEQLLDIEIILVLPVNCYKYMYKGGGVGGGGRRGCNSPNKVFFICFSFFLFFKSILSQKLSLTFFFYSDKKLI